MNIENKVQIEETKYNNYMLEKVSHWFKEVSFSPEICDHLPYLSPAFIKTLHYFSVCYSGPPKNLSVRDRFNLSKDLIYELKRTKDQRETEVLLTLSVYYGF
jgi:hypothetical protein